MRRFFETASDHKHELVDTLLCCAKSVGDSCTQSVQHVIILKSCCLCLRLLQRPNYRVVALDTKALWLLCFSCTWKDCRLWNMVVVSLSLSQLCHCLQGKDFGLRWLRCMAHFMSAEPCSVHSCFSRGSLRREHSVAETARGFCPRDTIVSFLFSSPPRYIGIGAL